MLRRASPNWKHLEPALLISRHEYFHFYRLLDPILLRRFLYFRPFLVSARFFRPFGTWFGRLVLVSLPRPFTTHIPVPVCAMRGIFVPNYLLIGIDAQYGYGHFLGSGLVGLC